MGTNKVRHTVWHIALEPIPARYSAQWLDCINTEFQLWADANCKDTWDMIDILGESIPTDVTSGGFLNFTATNAWKASQVVRISNLFQKGYITAGDVFFFTDAWNPAVLMVKYMSDLMDIPVKLVGYWHAGSYDKWDVLGYKIKDRTWSLAAEKAMYHAFDHNIFATEYHACFFGRHCLGLSPHWDFGREGFDNPLAKMVVAGQPHYEIVKWFEEKHATNRPPKEDIVLFPHRLAPEKQPEIFDELARRLPQYKFLRTQDLNLSKDDYYQLMLRTKVVFSCAQHEMLGISQMEGVLADCIPLMPDRISYHEMYPSQYLYPGEWADSPAHPVDYDRLEMTIKNVMELGLPHTDIRDMLAPLKEHLITKYMTSVGVWRTLTGDCDTQAPVKVQMNVKYMTGEVDG